MATVKSAKLRPFAHAELELLRAELYTAGTSALDQQILGALVLAARRSPIEAVAAVVRTYIGLAYRTGRVQVSNDVRSDERWTPHPKAQAGREYESIVSVPLTFEGEVDGVLNVVGEHRDAFDTADQTYISLLGSAIDVARAIGEQWRQPTR